MMTKQQLLDIGFAGVDVIDADYGGFGPRRKLYDVLGVGAAVQGGAQIAGATLQYKAAQNATEAQERQANNALGFQKQVYGDQRSDAAPYQQAGTNALGQIVSGIGTTAPGSLTSPDFVNIGYDNGAIGSRFGSKSSGWLTKFNSDAPQLDSDFKFTGDDLSSDPGYNFTLSEGLKALERNAASTGATGGAAAKATAQYATGLANTTFNDAYARALSARQENRSTQAQNFGQDSQTYNNNLNYQQQWFNQDAASFDRDLAAYQVNRSNNDTNFNHLASLAGIGQTATQQTSNAGAQAANNYTNTAAAVGNAQAAGAIAGGNAISNGISGASNAFNNYMQYRSLYGGGGSGNQFGSHGVAAGPVDWGAYDATAG